MAYEIVQTAEFIEKNWLSFQDFVRYTYIIRESFTPYRADRPILLLSKCICGLKLWVVLRKSDYAKLNSSYDWVWGSASAKLHLGAFIHKLDTLTRFWGFLTPSTIRRQVYNISLCTIVEIRLTSPLSPLSL